MAQDEINKEILDQLKQINNNISSFEDRISKLEISSKNVTENDNVPSQQQDNNSYQDPRSNDVAAATVGPDDTRIRHAADIQRDFERLKDTLTKIPVPDGFKVKDNNTGIKKEDKHALKIISKCSRYAETALKILSNQPSNDDISNTPSHNDQFQCLYTCLAAQINFLQSEFTHLVVKSTFDQETERIFRQFENNSTTFSDSSLQNIRIAAELSAITGRQTPNRGSFRGNRYRGQSSFNRTQQQGWRTRGDFAGRTFTSRPTLQRNDVSARPADEA